MKMIEAAVLALMLLATIGLIWISGTEPCEKAAKLQKAAAPRSCEMSGRDPERRPSP